MKVVYTSHSVGNKEGFGLFALFVSEDVGSTLSFFKCSDQRVVCEGGRKKEINLEFRIRFLFLVSLVSLKA